MADFRSERMPSPDGQGLASGALEKAWGAYSRAVRPMTDPLAKRLAPLLMPMARGASFDLIGFWVSWHLLGGFDGLQTHLGMSRSAVYRRIAAFRTLFGQHPDVYRFPGIELDLYTFLNAEPSPETDSKS